MPGLLSLEARGPGAAGRAPSECVRRKFGLSPDVSRPLPSKARTKRKTARLYAVAHEERRALASLRAFNTSLGRIIRAGG
jgi:hypothetical protein